MSRARPFRLRRLTAGEQELAREIFGRGLAPERVRILALPVWRRAFVAGPGMIVWPAGALPADFATAPIGLQATFVHELVHVWQAQKGVWLLPAKLRAGDSPRAYAYEACDCADFAHLNIEQQAMVVEHAFLAARGAQAPLPAELYARLAPLWREA